MAAGRSAIAPLALVAFLCLQLAARAHEFEVAPVAFEHEFPRFSLYCYRTQQATGGGGGGGGGGGDQSALGGSGSGSWSLVSLARCLPPGSPDFAATAASAPDWGVPYIRVGYDSVATVGLGAGKLSTAFMRVSVAPQPAAVEQQQDALNAVAVLLEALENSADAAATVPIRRTKRVRKVASLWGVVEAYNKKLAAMGERFQKFVLNISKPSLHEVFIQINAARRKRITSLSRTSVGMSLKGFGEGGEPVDMLYGAHRKEGKNDWGWLVYESAVTRLDAVFVQPALRQERMTGPMRAFFALFFMHVLHAVYGPAAHTQHAPTGARQLDWWTMLPLVPLGDAARLVDEHTRRTLRRWWVQDVAAGADASGQAVLPKLQRLVCNAALNKFFNAEVNLKGHPCDAFFTATDAFTVSSRSRLARYLYDAMAVTDQTKARYVGESDDAYGSYDFKAPRSFARYSSSLHTAQPAFSVAGAPSFFLQSRSPKFFDGALHFVSEREGRDWRLDTAPRPWAAPVLSEILLYNMTLAFHPSPSSHDKPVSEDQGLSSAL